MALRRLVGTVCLVVAAAGSPATHVDLSSGYAVSVADSKREEARATRLVTLGAVSNLSIAADGKGGFSVTPQGSSAVTFVVNADTVYTAFG